MSLGYLEITFPELWDYFDRDLFRMGILFQEYLDGDPTEVMQKMNTIAASYQEGIRSLTDSYNISHLSEKLLTTSMIAKESKSENHESEFDHTYKTFITESEEFVKVLLPELKLRPETVLKSISIRNRDGQDATITNTHLLMFLEDDLLSIAETMRSMTGYKEKVYITEKLNRRNSPPIRALLRDKFVISLVSFLECNTELIKKQQYLFVGEFLKLIGEPLTKRDGKAVLPQDYGSYISKTIFRRRQ